MRWLGLLFVMACAARQTNAWTAVEARDVDDGSEAFVLVGQLALHVANVHVVDGHMRARIVHAWELPPAGVAALANDEHSPEAIARTAGWSELALANRRLDIPVDAVRSARETVATIDEDQWNADNDPGDHPVLEAVVTSLVEVAFAKLAR